MANNNNVPLDLDTDGGVLQPQPGEELQLLQEPGAGEEGGGGVPGEGGVQPGGDSSQSHHSLH